MKKIITSLVSFLVFLPLVSFAAGLTTGQGGTGTTTWQTKSIPFFNGTRFIENNANFNFFNAGNLLTVTNASTTALSSVVFCLTGDICRTTWPSSASGGDPFTHTSVYGQTTSATSTLLALTGSPFSLVASSTVNFVQASSTLSTIFTKLFLPYIANYQLLGTDGNGSVVATTSIGYNMILGGPTGANPTASLGLTAVNGTAATFMRSDAAPALDQTIAPTMTGAWAFSNSATTTFASGIYSGTKIAAPYFIATSTTATSTLTNLFTTSLHVSSKLYADELRTAGGGGGSIALTPTGSGVVYIADGASGIATNFRTNLLTTVDKNFTFPDVSGTFCLIGANCVGTTSPFLTGQSVFANANGTLSSVATSTLNFSLAYATSTNLGSLIGGSSGIVSSLDDASFTWFATSTVFVGTTTVPLQQKISVPETFNSGSCKAYNGNTITFLNVQLGYGTASTTMIQASSTVGTVPFSANNTPWIGAQVQVDIGTSTSITVIPPMYVNCTFKRTR